MTDPKTTDDEKLESRLAQSTSETFAKRPTRIIVPKTRNERIRPTYERRTILLITEARWRISWYPNRLLITRARARARPPVSGANVPNENTVWRTIVFRNIRVRDGRLPAPTIRQNPKRNADYQSRRYDRRKCDGGVDARATPRLFGTIVVVRVLPPPDYVIFVRGTRNMVATTWLYVNLRPTDEISKKMYPPSKKKNNIRRRPSIRTN